jgi:signal transduction histidine kinase
VQLAAEAGLAFVFGAGWFALLTLLVGSAVFSSRAVLALTVIVLDVALVWMLARILGIGYGVAVGVAGVVALDWYCIPPIHAADVPNAENALALGAYLVAGTLLGQLAASARRRAEESEQEVRLLAEEQAALRRVATLVAVESAPEDVFASVTEEVGKLLRLDVATLLRYETDGSATVLAAWSREGRHLPLGSRWHLDSGTVASRVWDSGRPQRVDDYAETRGAFAESLRGLGVRSSAGSPVIVEGALWGVMIGASLAEEPIAEGTELLLGEFTQLTGAAVANAESRGELTASRARLVASSDEARQRIERDLHDGVQQRLVSLALEVSHAESMAEPEQVPLRDELSSLREGLVGVVDELREVAHGIHPAILTEGGLRPALATLARRSPVPVDLDVRGGDRLPDAMEVGLYYVASEALTNVIKHAQATHVVVDLQLDPTVARLQVSDDGVGGADVRAGSGLVGLTDRLHALGGTIEVRSPAGEGTRLDAHLPLSTGGSAPSPDLTREDLRH